MSNSNSNAAGPSTSQHVMSVLQTLYVDPDPGAKKRAGEWLEEFQHSEQAWQTCHELLTNPDSPLEGRLFSAQTFRAKITYDLSQLPREQLPPLRDSLIASLTALTSPTAPTGSRAVSTQLSLALSDLAIQMPEWENVVQGMIDRFGSDAQTVGVLLGFLKCLVEESGNPRIAISANPQSEQARNTLTQMISGNAESVLGVLAMYIQAQGLTAQITTAIFETLSSWLAAGEIIPSQVAQTPLFDTAFSSLSSDQLFDPAVDLLCDLIHETQEIDDNVDIIQMIVPRLVALRPELSNHKEDPDRIRGYCRLFCEAGETYTDLIARHPDDLLALVEAVAECAAYEDLEIVQITFNFWYNLATALGRTPQDPRFQPILAIYASLQSVIISRLHFPADDEAQTAQERDEFRMFRHRMGDTLKDCCHVLGATTCLRTSYDMVATALTKPSPTWQEIEAPLFSMRSMGAEVDNDDEEVLPHIMEMLPRLPDHPRIRYAAILVISRYTQWINRHPSNLAFQLQYVSAGFEIADESVSAAAAQAMKFMCQDCHQHLVPFLPQLHTFVGSVGDKLEQADMVEVMEAIGYVVSSMPAEDGARALQQFSQPLLERVQVVASEENPGKEGLMKVADALEQLDSLLTPVRTLEPFPSSCLQTAPAVYQIFDTLLSHHAKTYFISDRMGSTLRRGLQFFPLEALQPVVQPLMERMAGCFEQTGFASYLWIIGKVASKFGPVAVGPGGEGLAGLLGGAFEKVTQVLASRLGERTAVEMPDVMDDYSHCFMAYLNAVPALTLSLPYLSTAITHILSSLSCPAPEIIRISLDVLAKLSDQLPTQPQLQTIFNQYGKGIITLVLQGLIQDFPEDCMEEIEKILVGTMGVVGSQGEAWAGEALGSVPGHLVPVVDRSAFLAELHEYLVQPGGDRLRLALRNLVRSARRAKERGRQSRKSMGTA